MIKIVAAGEVTAFTPYVAEASQTTLVPHAAAKTFAPLNRAEPDLDISPAAVRANFICAGQDLKDREPARSSRSGDGNNPERRLSLELRTRIYQSKRPWCAVTLPQSADGDIQRAGEYVAAAMREVARTSGNRIDILGWSQGGMMPRWALRFWPDTRLLVADMIGLAPSNHGTVAVEGVCSNACIPALRQEGIGSQFLTALNSRAETFRGIAYTNIFSHTDIVQPNHNTRGSSSLHTGEGVIANIALPDVCPANIAKHFALGTYDPVAYALVIDALAHSGKGASAKRIPRAVCREKYGPEVNAATFETDFGGLNAYVNAHRFDAPASRAEPRLAPYVFARWGMH